jgi:hypothetical protein
MRNEIETMRGRICQALAVAAFAELVLNRTITRAGIFIPKHGLAADAYGIISLISQPIFAAAMLLAVVHTMLVVVLLATMHLGPVSDLRGLRRAAAAAICAVLISALILAGYPPSLWSGQVFGWLAMLALILLATPAAPARRWLALAIAATGALSLASTLLPGLGQAASRSAITAAAPHLTAAGEAVLLIGVLPLAAAVGRRPLAGWPAIAGLFAGLLFAVAYLAAPAMMATMAIWTLGLTLYLPFPLYGLALALWCYALLSGQEGAGVVLLLAAGIGLTVSLHHLLLIGALYALTVAPTEIAEAPERETRAARSFVNA